MKIKNKNIKKSVDNVTLEFKRTLTKAIIDLMKLTGYQTGNLFSFSKPVVITRAHTWGDTGVKVNGDIILINGLKYYDGRGNSDFFIACYDCDGVLSSIYFHPEDYMLLYNAVRKTVLNY